MPSQAGAGCGEGANAVVGGKVADSSPCLSGHTAGLREGPEQRERDRGLQSTVGDSFGQSPPLYKMRGLRRWSQTPPEGKLVEDWTL